jgi:hypothetical protein
MSVGFRCSGWKTISRIISRFVGHLVSLFFARMRILV